MLRNGQEVRSVFLGSNARGGTSLDVWGTPQVIFPKGDVVGFEPPAFEAGAPQSCPPPTRFPHRALRRRSSATLGVGFQLHSFF